MNDYFVSLIRTWVPIVVGVVLTWVGDQLGFPIDSTEMAMAVTGVVIAVYYGVVRKLEELYPAIGILLGNRQPPTYGLPEE